MAFGHKHEIEEALAAIADGGVIVEVGGGVGNGAARLLSGTNCGRRLPIYVIDPYEPFVDLLGGIYGPETREEFLRSIEGVGHRVTLIEAMAQDVSAEWELPVALLWVDISQDYWTLREIFDKWQAYVIPGGYMAVTGLEYGALGTAAVMEYALLQGWKLVWPEQNLVAVLRKPLPRRAVFYIVNGANGGQYIEEACRSASSVKREMGLPVLAYSPASHSAWASDFVDEVVPLPEAEGPFWYLDCTRWLNWAVRDLEGRHYEEALYLDSDTYACGPEAVEVFDVLRHYDVAMGQSPQRDAIDSTIGTPPSFTAMEHGVDVFRLNARMLRFFRDWLERYEARAAVYDDNDQCALRDALWENMAGVAWMALAPEFSLRFDFGAWVVGRVRFLHGRHKSVSQHDLGLVAKEINAHMRMRIWSHGLLPPSAS